MGIFYYEYCVVVNRGFHDTRCMKPKSKRSEESIKVSELVGDEIRKARLKAEMSQEQLSAEAGFYRTYVGHVEVGRYTPSIYTIYKIAKALKVKASSLIPF